MDEYPNLDPNGQEKFQERLNIENQAAVWTKGFVGISQLMYTEATMCGLFYGLLTG